MKLHKEVLEAVINALILSKENDSIRQGRMVAKVYVNQDNYLTVEAFNPFQCVRKRFDKSMSEFTAPVLFHAESIQMLKALLSSAKKTGEMVDVSAAVYNGANETEDLDRVWPKSSDECYTISFNVAYLENLLNVLRDHKKSESVTLHMTSNKNPILVTVGKSDGAGVLMPIRHDDSQWGKE